MRRDRTGEPIEDEPDDQPAAEPDRHSCNGGWLGEDDEGRPRPCLICRPNLARHRGQECPCGLDHGVPS